MGPRFRLDRQPAGRGSQRRCCGLPSAYPETRSTTSRRSPLLYYCQGHHLAWFGEPLFTEAIEAWDMGPVVAELWRAENRGTSTPPGQELGSRELNTVGYVLSRYGNLTGKDLEILSHGEDPWREADQHRRPGSAARIAHDALVTWFRADHDERSPGPAVLAQLRRAIAEAPPVPHSPDCADRVRVMRDEFMAAAAAACAAKYARSADSQTSSRSPCQASHT
ncbi:MAG: Panacea domain-containing protein [Pseudonocardiaceae bacterium]